MDYLVIVIVHKTTLQAKYYHKPIKCTLHCTKNKHMAFQPTPHIHL